MLRCRTQGLHTRGPSVAAHKSTSRHQEALWNRRPDQENASKVVSGDRSGSSKKDFDIIYKFADKISVAVAAGYVPSELQVNQPGKIIAPGLYMAVGTSSTSPASRTPAPSSRSTTTGTADLRNCRFRAGGRSVQAPSGSGAGHRLIPWPSSVRVDLHGPPGLTLLA